jgi:hypothetical protein
MDPSPLVIEFWSCEDARHAREKLIILSAIPEIMEKLGYDETEARRMLASVCPPEVAAPAGDDWETNPLTLDLLKILREPNGNRKIMEAGLECGAAAYGVSVEETLLRICLLPDVSLETKFELARIARDRGLPGVVLVFSSPDRR